MTFPDDKFASSQKYIFQASVYINFIYSVTIYEAPLGAQPCSKIGSSFFSGGY